MKHCDMCRTPSSCTAHESCNYTPTPAKESPSGGSERRLVQRLFVARARMAPHQRERENGKLILDCCEFVAGMVLSIAHLEACLVAGAKIIKQDGQWCLFADDGNGIKCRDTLEELLTDLPPLNVRCAPTPAKEVSL